MSCCGFNGQNSRGLQGFGIDNADIDNADYYADQVTDILYEDYLLAEGIPLRENAPVVPPDPADGQPPAPLPPPTIIEKLKTTDETDEGYGVDPLKKKFEPYIIGGLVAVGVLFIFGMVKTGGGNDERRSTNE